MTRTDAADQHGQPSRPPRWLPVRGLLLALLAPIEIVILDSFYDVRALSDGAPFLALNLALKTGAYAALYALGALALMAWPRRRALADLWRAAPGAPDWPLWLALNLFTFTALLGMTPLLRELSAPWTALSVWIAGVVVMIAALAAALGPPSFWRRVLAARAGALAAAAIAGASIAGAALLAQNSWDLLADATLRLSFALLHAFEPNAVMEPAHRLIGAGSFKVIVDAYCSGYEGVGLVVAALALFLVLFRRQLRFPQVLIILPIGAGAVWLLNAGRIALLVAIGAHASPEIALKGFHSQAGWILFVAVTGGLMAWTHAAFRTDAPRRADPAIRLSIALLAPFAALMGVHVLATIFGDGAHWIAPASFVAPALALWLNRAALYPLFGRATLEPMLIGLAVGAAWAATEPAHPHDSLGPWLAAQPGATAAAWLALRVLGFALIAPLAEELVFRGYLHRALVARRFETASPGAFSWVAFALTSLAFGALHARWLAGLLAGAAFAFTLYRSRSLTGPVTAHIAANGLIAAYAAAAGEWALL